MWSYGVASNKTNTQIEKCSESKLTGNGYDHIAWKNNSVTVEFQSPHILPLSLFSTRNEMNEQNALIQSKIHFASCTEKKKKKMEGVRAAT